MRHKIAFPGLGIGPFTIRDSFSFFGIPVHWYGVFIVSGILLAYLFCKQKAAKRDINSETLLDVILWGLPAAIICARIYYVAFSWSFYKNHLLDIFKIWEGGIAIYGAIIGASIAALLYCRIKKIKVAKIFDVSAFGLLIGQILGRWGNFVNAEAYGSETNTALLRMHLIDLGITVHPTFFYESAWNFLVFLFLNGYERHQNFDGEIFLIYLVGYGIGRFFIEGLRQDSLYFGPVRVSQILAALCVVVGLVLIIYGRVKQAKKEAI